jgi:hypothetical protein
MITKKVMNQESKGENNERVDYQPKLTIPNVMDSY